MTSTTTTGKSNHWSVWLSTGLGAGYLPTMPGTYGAAEGVLVFLGLYALLGARRMGNVEIAIAVAALCLASTWVTAIALPHFTSSDPQVIVIDEVAGQAVTLSALLFWPADAHWTWLHILAGFILFRLFDITKPLFIRRLDQLHGAWGVVGDDIGAGVAGGAILLAWGYLAR